MMITLTRCENCGGNLITDDYEPGKLECLQCAQPHDENGNLIAPVANVKPFTDRVNINGMKVPVIYRRNW